MGIPDSNIMSAFDGDEALKKLESNILENLNEPEKPLISLIITDYCIPCASGIEILKKAKQLF